MALILTSADVQRTITMSKAIAVMRQAFRALSGGQAVAPLRTALQVPGQTDTVLVMPAAIATSPVAEVDSLSSEATLAVKLVSIFPRNLARGLAVVLATVLLLDADTGQLRAVIDGTYLTALRTGAASGLATDVLANRDAASVALFGSGVQARTQLLAVCSVRPIERVRIFSPTPEHSQTLAREMPALLAAEGLAYPALEIAGSSQEALAGASIVICATSSASPVFDDKDLAVGAHINGIGSYTPAMQEVPGETVCRARVIVDSREAALAEAGDVLIPLQQGLISRKQVEDELGEVLLSEKLGRLHPDQITFFKSVGVAVQDAAIASAVYQAARTKRLGVEINLG